jgi:hypothetical protein
MIAQIQPVSQLDVFPMMEIALLTVWDFREDKISISNIDTPEALDNLLLYGIRVKYEKDNFMVELLKRLNTEKYNFTVKYQE